MTTAMPGEIAWCPALTGTTKLCRPGAIRPVSRVFEPADVQPVRVAAGDLGVVGQAGPGTA